MLYQDVAFYYFPIPWMRWRWDVWDAARGIARTTVYPPYLILPIRPIYFSPVPTQTKQSCVKLYVVLPCPTFIDVARRLTLLLFLLRSLL